MLMSRHFFPVPADWPARYRTVGFLVWDVPSDSQTNAEVDQFLSAGEPPVLVTLGHLGAALSPQRFEMIAETLDELGVRSILTVGYDANLTSTLRDRPGVWPHVPISRVLPRCRAVVHVGGLGTLAAILSGGAPALVLPQTPESRWSARRVEELGVGIGLSRRALRRGPLRRALTRLLDDARCATRARDFARLLEGEDGATNAADEIERLVHVSA